ncbi:MAG: phenylalanine--tRNA ligase subunit beta [Oligoflexia bacterium]|nr:phenylalanine--tRNA ligase subunit beta [Oligoflexia bacterium]
MRVPVSLLRKLSPVRDTNGPVPVADLATVMNARVSEVEKIHRFPSRDAFSKWSLRRQQDGLLVVVDAQGHPATESDLGIGPDTSHPVSLGPDVPDDADIFDALELDDAVIEFDLEPNRPDLFSLVGMARDAAAIWGSGTYPPTGIRRDWPDTSSVRIAVAVPQRVPRYVAVELKGIAVGPSPQWLQNTVRKLGMRPINNVVDATNLVMMELGQPMHTFDRRQIQSGVIGLRMARDGETMTTLDGVDRVLTDECLLVTDGDPEDGGVPVALAGIMGSEGSGVTPDTSAVLIEAASFDMAAVRRASRRLSLRTEASLRFEKGLPQSGVGPAVARLVSLLEQVCGPQVQVAGYAEHWPSPPPPRQVMLDASRLRQRLAMDLSDVKIDQILGMAGCRVERRQSLGATSAQWRVQLPEHRPDLAIQEDLEEEVGRIYGYDHVHASLPQAQLRPVPHNPSFHGAAQVRDVLLAWGLDEVYLSAWVSDDDLKTCCLPAPGTDSPLVELANPLNVELRYFRPSALPAVLAAIRENRKQLDSLGLFEIGRVYLRAPDGTIVETPSLAGAVVDPPSQQQGGAFYRVRDALLDLAERMGVSLSVQPVDSDMPPWAGIPLLHPGRAASLQTKDGVLIGVFGEIHPRMVSDADLREAPTVFSVDLAALYQNRGSRQRRFHAPPRFPSVDAHLNVVAPARLLAADLLARIDAPNLVRRDVRGVWTGKGVPEGHRQLTLSLEFNHPDRSLTHPEVMDRLTRIVATLRQDPSLHIELPT